MSENIQPGNMIPIPISEFVSGAILPVDVFIKLGESHYVLLAKAGTATQVQQLLQYQEKSVSHLHIRKDDYSKYVDQNIVIAGVILSKSQWEGKKKADFLRKAASAVSTEIVDLGFNYETFEHAKQVTNATVELVEAQKDLGSLLESMLSADHALVNHASVVSVLCTMIAKTVGWNNRTILEKLALGGLLHDIGKKELAPELLAKPRAHYTREEIVQWEQHPFRGVKILETVSTVPEDVIAMVYEHHENSMGQGFPRHLKDVRTNPLARVCIVANAFCELIMPDHGAKRTPEESIVYLRDTLGCPFNKTIFRALANIVDSRTDKAKNKRSA